jgi:hypothetical protein
VFLRDVSIPRNVRPNANYIYLGRTRMSLLIRQRSRVGWVPTKPPTFVLGVIFLFFYFYNLFKNFNYVFFNIVFPSEIVACREKKVFKTISQISNILSV